MNWRGERKEVKHGMIFRKFYGLRVTRSQKDVVQVVKKVSMDVFMRFSHIIIHFNSSRIDLKRTIL